MERISEAMRVKRICRAGVDESKGKGRLCTRWLHAVRKLLNEMGIMLIMLREKKLLQDERCVQGR